MVITYTYINKKILEMRKCSHISKVSILIRTTIMTFQFILRAEYANTILIINRILLWNYVLKKTKRLFLEWWKQDLNSTHSLCSCCISMNTEMWQRQENWHHLLQQPRESQASCCVGHWKWWPNCCVFKTLQKREQLIKSWTAAWTIYFIFKGSTWKNSLNNFVVMKSLFWITDGCW